MNLGLWLTDHKAKLDTNVTFLFEDSLALIYKICKLCIKKLSSLTIVIEEDFENIYLTFIPSNSIECMELADKLSNEIKQNLLCETTLIYLTVKINNDIKISFAEPFKLQEQKGRDKLNLSEDDVRMLRRSHTDKISAAEFVREYAESGSMDEIHDLRDIEDKWRELVGEIGVIKTKDSVSALVDQAIEEYARVVNKIYEFSAIGYALSSLCAFLRASEESKIIEIAPKLSMLLEHMLEDLANWRNTIFITRGTPDIHYLDSSLLSSCMQMDALLGERVATSTDDDDELELF